MSNNLPSPFRFLHKILENPTFSSIISWSDDGNSFYIHSLPEFSNTILKNYYPGLACKKFFKQLKNLEFSKTVTGSLIQFQNPNFKRMKSKNLKKIQTNVQNPSRKKSSYFNDFSDKVRILESSQHRMEESMDDLESKFEKIIELNKYLISELNINLETERSKFDALKQHLLEITENNKKDIG